MAKMYYDTDSDFSLLKGKKIAVIGYGSQGHAHALNLSESGYDVVIGLREDSKTREKVLKDGLKVMDTAKAVEVADLIMFLVPDEKQADIYKKDVEPNLKEGNVLMFAHGFNINFNQILPPSFVDVIMVAPKGPGHTVRTQYQEGKGVPALIAIYQDSTSKAKDYAYMRYSISDTAEYGDYVTGKRIITEETRKEMKKVLAEIQDGTFASNWVTENKAGGRAKFLGTRRKEAEHQLETVGGELRKMMSWLKK